MYLYTPHLSFDGYLCLGTKDDLYACNLKTSSFQQTALLIHFSQQHFNHFQKKYQPTVHTFYVAYRRLLF